jgi:hypothetical protein
MQEFFLVEIRGNCVRNPFTFGYLYGATRGVRMVARAVSGAVYFRHFRQALAEVLWVHQVAVGRSETGIHLL